MRNERESVEKVRTRAYRESGRVRPDEQLARIGRLQHRQVTTAQLTVVGWDKDAIRRRVEAGRLHPVYAEVYSLGGPPQNDKELWMAATLTYGRGAKLGASAAAELYGWLRYPLGEIHVLTPTPRRSRDGIRAYHREKPGRWGRIDGIPVTGPEQTVLDCALTVRSGKAYRRVVRQAQIDHTTHTRLLAFGAVNRGVRGVARMRRELAEGPSRTRSVNEDQVLELLRHGGEPIPNAIVHGEELDLYFPDANAGIEVMSALHDSPTAQADDLAKKERLARKGVRLYWLS